MEERPVVWHRHSCLCLRLIRVRARAGGPHLHGSPERAGLAPSGVVGVGERSELGPVLALVRIRARALARPYVALEFLGFSPCEVSLLIGNLEVIHAECSVETRANC